MSARASYGKPYSIKELKKWTENVEKILSQQQNKCAAYKWLHERQCRNLVYKNKWLNITSIIIVSVSATGSSIANNIEDPTRVYRWVKPFNIIFPILLYFSAVLSSLQQFLNYEKQAEKNRRTAIRYTALYNNIKRMLILDPEQRQEVHNYFNWANKEYDSIFTSAPDISASTVNIFEDKFNTDFALLKSDTEQNTPQQPDEQHQKIIVLDDLEDPVVNETEKLKYELDRFIVNSYSS